MESVYGTIPDSVTAPAGIPVPLWRAERRALHAMQTARRELRHRTRDDIERRRRWEQDGYSLPTLERIRTVFLHIPKAAGVSVNRAIYGNLGGGHRTAGIYRELFGPRTYARYFSFTFVRDPLTRLQSAYAFLKTGGMNAEDRDWAARNLAGVESFERFVLDWLDETRIWDGIHLKPQYHFLCDVYPVLCVDFIGRFERFDTDFRKVTTHLDLDAPSRHDNPTKGRREEGVSDAVRARVQQLYRRDYELLGYPLG